MEEETLGPRRRIVRSLTATGEFSSDFKDSEIVPSSLSEVARILRVAKDIEIEQKNPQIAHLCRKYAYQKTHELDPYSKCRGVRQFKTSLQQKLKEDSLKTHFQESSAAKELCSLYLIYIQELKSSNEKDREKNARASSTAEVLYDVIHSLNALQPEIVEASNYFQEKKDIYSTYNIIPLRASQPTDLEEINVVLAALRTIQTLPMPSTRKVPKIASLDLLDWLQVMFGFQKDNVSNQREHLVLLLANMHVRLNKKALHSHMLDDSAVNQLLDSLFENYKNWCNFLGHKSAIGHQITDQENDQLRKLLYIGLYLLIWGEAANLRFMPECLCYIFHQMASELHGMLANPSVATAYGGEQDSFLRNIISPIYNVIQKEVQKNRNGTTPHSDWRNYDDLNEYFWSTDCFNLGWPWKEDADFFQIHTHVLSYKGSTNVKPNVGKVNYVEIRSFWHLFRSFDRMWTFYILVLQVMLILSWTEKSSLLDLLQISVLENILSIFVTAAILRLIQVILDISLNYKAYCWKEFSHIWRPLIKLVVALVWVLILPVCYLHSWDNPSGILNVLNSWIGSTKKLPSLYITAVAIYISPNVLGSILFVFPFVRTWIENSSLGIVQNLLLWSEPRLYVGRGMRESTATVFKYTVFWSAIIIIKICFSYFVQIRPLVKITKAMTAVTRINYQWHELFPHGKYNIGAVISTWAPVILVYFMDTQIWYAIVSTLVGGVIGAFHRLGEVRTLSMLRSRFHLLPGEFNRRLVASKEISDGQNEHTSFDKFWNQMILSFRDEDIISDREQEFLLVPSSLSDPYFKIKSKQWPPFLLVSKVPAALNLLEKIKSKDQDKLWRRISAADRWTEIAVKECYELFRIFLEKIIIGEIEKKVLKIILQGVDNMIENKKFAKCLHIENFDLLSTKVIELTRTLQDSAENLQQDNPDNTECRSRIMLLLQDMIEVLRRDIFVEEECSPLLSEIQETENNLQPKTDRNNQKEKARISLAFFFNSPDSIDVCILKSTTWKEQIKRLHLLLTLKESAMDVPANFEARRRITFLCNSLFMEMPKAPRVCNMMSFSVLTPYNKEETIYSKEHLFKSNEDGISILFYLKRIYPDEWKNFRERMGIDPDDLKEDESSTNIPELELRLWASSRGQTLFKTIKGMMYYQRALQLQAVLEDGEEETFDGIEGHDKGNTLLAERAVAIVNAKFTYVVSCQQYGLQRRSKDKHAADILSLMVKYPSLRVAYIDIRESMENDKMNKEYFSVLVKAVNGLDEEIYRIKLPGPPILGEGKPENQNHAIVFTRGEALQAIDMNQGNYLEEAFKMRNLLEEFRKIRGSRYPTILGVRENIFTGSVSSLAWFMSMQENAFVTIGQRVLANPLKIRFYYGHPDILSRIFHISRGGISKASRVINLSEDIFAGFNSTLRQGSITHHEYIQVGKGRDVGLNQISKYEAKTAYGNGEQVLSRDIYRLGHRFDFFRMLSFYFTTVGPYVSSTIIILTMYIFLYGRLYLALSGLEASLLKELDLSNNVPLEATFACQSLVQLGLLMTFPMVIEIILEGGFMKAVSDFILMQLQLVSVFFTFSLGTKVHHFCRAILHGNAKYKASDHGFVVRHERFAANYRMYSRSHFLKGMELLVLLLIYSVYGTPSGNLISDFLIFSLWFLVASWLFGPFLFNPSGLEWQKIVEDWDDWNRWFTSRGSIGMSSIKSWESWWIKEHDYLNYTGPFGRIWEIILALRFLLYQYGLVYHLDIVKGNKQIQVYGLSWLVIAALVTLITIISLGRQQLDAEFQLLFRLFKALLFLIFVSILMTLFLVFSFTFRDLLTCFLAFLPTGWALLQISLACKPIITALGLWDTVKTIARGYEYMIGLLLFAPLAVLSWFPFVSEFQSRLLFNQAFSRGLQMSRILAGSKEVPE